MRDSSHRRLARPGSTLLPAGNKRLSHPNAFPGSERPPGSDVTYLAGRALARRRFVLDRGRLTHLRPRRRYPYVEPRCRAFVGYSEAEIAGQPLARLLPVSEAPTYEGLLRAAIKGEFPHCQNTERLRKDGRVVRVAVNHLPIRNESGEITAILERAHTFSCRVGDTAPEAQLRFLA